MKKNIVIFVLGLILGVVFSAAIAILYYTPKLASSMFMLQEKEIVMQGETSYEAYLNDKPSIAIWAIRKHIDSLNRVKEELSSAETDNRYFMLSPDVDLFFAHGRLGILYKKIGNDEKSKFHFKQAISHKNTGKKKIETEEDLIPLISKIDENMKSKK